MRPVTARQPRSQRSVLTVRLIGWWALLALARPAAHGQDTSQVAPGDGVRVSAPSRGWKRWTGYFVGFRGDSVVVRATVPDTAVETVPIAAVERFEVNHGNQPPRSRTVEGVVKGTGIGLGYGLVHTAIYPCEDTSSWFCDPVNIVASFTLFGAAAGAIMGTLVRTPPYRNITLEPRVALVPLPGDRVGLTIQVHVRE